LRPARWLQRNSDVIHPRTCLAVALAALAFAFAPRAFADPHPGAPAPAFTAIDLNGHVHSSRELAQHPTLVVVCTSGDASRAADEWLQRAHAQMAHAGVRVITVVALSLPFFVTDGMVRDRARPQTPNAAWGDTWIEIHGNAQRALGVSDGSSTPYVFTVDSTGHVLASVHVAVQHPNAHAIFASLVNALSAMVVSPDPRRL